MRYVLRVKWSSLEKGVTPSPTIRCNEILVTLDDAPQLFSFALYICSIVDYIYIYIYIYIYSYIYIYIYVESERSVSVSLFNGISTFVGYLMPNLSF